MTETEPTTIPSATVPVLASRQNRTEQGNDEGKRRLTRMERKVLDVLLDPATRHSTGKSIYEAAECGETRYYEMMRDPWFEEQRRNLLSDLVRAQAAVFVKAAADTAATPGRDGFQDRRLLLSMSGDHVERRQHDVQLTGRVVVGVIGVSMDELG